MASVGLTLSGGGFRATLFHMGVVRLLHDADLLPAVKRIGAVSGGSILAAHLVLNWERYTGDDTSFDAAAREVFQFVRQDVRGRVIRRWVLAWLLGLPRLVRPRRWTFTNLLQRSYARLYRHASLGDLRANHGNSRPEVFFYSTSLSTGAPCYFSHEGFAWEEGDSSREIRAPSIPVAFAVAASSAFPPLFPPVAISNEILSCDLKDFPHPYYLTDGGVYDNLGIDRLMRHHGQESDEVVFLVSDAEGNFDWDLDQSYTFITTRNIRASDLLMKRVSTLEYENLLFQKPRPLVFDIDTEIPSVGQVVLPAEVQRSLRNIRTDLDEFSPGEISCLVRHGYAVARERLILGGLMPEGFSRPLWDPFPRPTATNDRVVREMQSSRRRKYRFWSPRDWVSWTSLMVLLAIGGFAYHRQRLLTQEAALAGRLTSENERLTQIAAQYQRQRHRPVQPGTSAGLVERTGGSICCFVRSRSADRRRYLLMAVPLSMEGRTIGESILQPGVMDGGQYPRDAVGQLARVVTVRPDTTNYAAGALAEVLPEVEVDPRITGLGSILGVAEPDLEQEVYIAGRTSGIARAVVKGINMRLQIPYPTTPVWFDGLIGLADQEGKAATRSGDGGAPVVTTDGKIIGMIIAGSPDLSIAVPIGPVLDALNVELDTGEP